MIKVIRDVSVAIHSSLILSSILRFNSLFAVSLALSFSTSFAGAFARYPALFSSFSPLMISASTLSSSLFSLCVSFSLSTRSPTGITISASGVTIVVDFSVITLLSAMNSAVDCVRFSI